MQEGKHHCLSRLSEVVTVVLRSTARLDVRECVNRMRHTKLANQERWMLHSQDHLARIGATWKVGFESGLDLAKLEWRTCLFSELYQLFLVLPLFPLPPLPLLRCCHHH